MATPIWDGGYRSLGGLSSCDYSLKTDSNVSSLSGAGGTHHDSQQGELSSRLDQQLSCAICLERYEDPRILKCSHSFCRRCLVNVLEQRPTDLESPLMNNQLMCPKCRMVTVLNQVGEGGVDALPVNFDLMGVVDLFDMDPGEPLSFPQPLSTHHPSHNTPSLPSQPLSFCTEHNRLLDFFCEKCDQLMCASCAVKQRCGHDVKEARELLDDLRSQCVDPLEIRHLRMNVAIDENKRMSDRLHQSCEDNKHRIRNMFQEIRNSLNSRELSLVQALEGIINKKCAALRAQCASLELLHNTLQSERDRVANLLNIRNDDYSILLQRKKLSEDVDKVITDADVYDRHPVENIKEGPDCNLPKGLLHTANSFGEIYCTPHPAKFMASGVGLEKAFVGREAEFVVEAHDKYSQRAFKSGNTVEVEISGPQGADIPATVVDAGRGKYLVRYTPTRVGFHTVKVLVDCQNISNCRTSLVAYNIRDYSSMAQPRRSLSRQHIHPEMSTVRSLCALSTGHVVFSDQLCLRMITLEGRLVRRAIGSFGVAQGQFNMPVGITCNARDEIFVADRQNHRVQKLSPDGRFINGYGGAGVKAGSLHYPEAVAVVDDRLFVVDTGNHRIQVFNQKTGKALKVIGGRGGDIQLRDPQGIAIDEAGGRLFIADSGNHRLLGLSLDAATSQLLTDFGQCGEVPIVNPTCVAVDADGFVLVTSAKAHLLTILTPRGLKVKHLGGDGTLFKTPYGICIDNSGNVIVADTTMPPSIIVL